MAARRWTSRSIRALAFALSVLSFATGDAAQGGVCTCPVPAKNRSQSAQSGDSVCMAAQDEKGCALQTIAVPQPGKAKAKTQMQDKEALEELRRQSALEGDADRKLSLEEAFRVAPVGWTDKEFDAVLRGVVEVAEKRLGPDGVAGLDGALRAHADELRNIYTDIAYERRVEQLGIGSYDAAVSYGCLEVTRSNFIAVIRAPFSAAGRRCNVF